MKRWLRRARGAIGMGLTWAIGWALAGILIGVASILLPFLPWDAFFEVFDAPLPALAMPGFVGGALFSLVLGIAGRRRSFHELSIPRFTAWGAAGGLLLGLVPAAMVALGLATPGPGIEVWEITAVITPPLTALCAVSAAATLAVARRGERRRALDGGEELAALERDQADARAMLDGGDHHAAGPSERSATPRPAAAPAPRARR